MGMGGGRFAGAKRKRTVIIDPLTFVVVVLCKTAQHVIGCLLVWMIFAMAISKR